MKLINQALVKEGFLKSRKSSAAINGTYYWISFKDGLKLKLEKTIDIYKQRVVKKQERVDKTKETLIECQLERDDLTLA